jgi:hypothetical protein
VAEVWQDGGYLSGDCVGEQHNVVRLPYLLGRDSRDCVRVFVRRPDEFSTRQVTEVNTEE